MLNPDKFNWDDLIGRHIDPRSSFGMHIGSVRGQFEGITREALIHAPFRSRLHAFWHYRNLVSNDAGPNVHGMQIDIGREFRKQKQELKENISGARDVVTETIRKKREIYEHRFHGRVSGMVWYSPRSVLKASGASIAYMWMLSMNGIHMKFHPRKTHHLKRTYRNQAAALGKTFQKVDAALHGMEKELKREAWSNLRGRAGRPRARAAGPRPAHAPA